MALIDKKILTPIRYHQDNANTVIGQASTMKALFDQGAEDLRVKLNGVIDELLATTGAQQIGIDPAKGLGNTLADALTNIKNYMNLGASSISAEVIGTGSGDNVQAQLLWLMNQIKTMVLGQIPEGTISIDKLTIELANLINGHTTQLAQKVSKTGDTMTGNLNVPTVNDKVPAYAISPTETIITTGFASGWSGEIRLGKTQEGIKYIHIVSMTKTSDISGGEVLYTIPIGHRPIKTVSQNLVGYSSGGSFKAGSSIQVRVQADGGLALTSTGSVTADVRSIVGAILTFI